jgi:hypothetical protein
MQIRLLLLLFVGRAERKQGRRTLVNDFNAQDAGINLFFASVDVNMYIKAVV